ALCFVCTYDVAHAYIASHPCTPIPLSLVVFFFHDTPTPEIYTLSLHDALPISLAVDELPDDLGRLRETGGPFGGRPQIDPVGVVLERVPRRADPEDRAPVRDVVERRRHVGEHRRMPMRNSRDEAADADVLRQRGVRGLGL